MFTVHTKMVGDTITISVISDTPIADEVVRSAKTAPELQIAAVDGESVTQSKPAFIISFKPVK